MTINVVSEIDEMVRVRNVLISVSNKDALDYLVTHMMRVVPGGVNFLSTGGTFKAVKKALDDAHEDPEMFLTQVSDFTGQPETQGGLVKTLDFKIYLGLLTETYNPSHQADLQRTRAFPIDMVVCNLYPFEETIADPDVTPEIARGNIDIGGPCMVRAAAKNFIRVAPVVDPSDYVDIVGELEQTKGFLSLDTRFFLAQKAFVHVAEYDDAIADHFIRTDIIDIKKCYGL